MQRQHSALYTIGFSAAVCVVCSLLVSASAVAAGPGVGVALERGVGSAGTIAVGGDAEARLEEGVGLGTVVTLTGAARQATAAVAIKIAIRMCFNEAIAGPTARHRVRLLRTSGPILAIQCFISRTETWLSWYYAMIITASHPIPVP